MDSLLIEAKGPFGERRFYPPGKHPALFRYFEQIERLELLPTSQVVNEALAYHRNQVALFEEGESLAKAEYLRAKTRRP